MFPPGLLGVFIGGAINEIQNVKFCIVFEHINKYRKNQKSIFLTHEKIAARQETATRCWFLHSLVEMIFVFSIFLLFRIRTLRSRRMKDLLAAAGVVVVVVAAHHHAPEAAAPPCATWRSEASVASGGASTPPTHTCTPRRPRGVWVGGVEASPEATEATLRQVAQGGAAPSGAWW